MDKGTFKKEIIFSVLFLLALEINVRPYSKNFFLPYDAGENLIDKISGISRSFITFEINDRWIDSRLPAMLSSRQQVNYNIIISGDTGKTRIKNIKQLSPKKVGYVVNEFIDAKKIEELNMLKPYNVFLIFKRIPESFELFYIREGRIRELVITLDAPSAAEFVLRDDLFSDFRLVLRPADRDALQILCKIDFPNEWVKIIADSRIIGSEDIFNTGEKCSKRMIYELSSLTYYNNFMKFIKSGITELNIYYSHLTPKRDNIFDWINKTDP